MGIIEVEPERPTHNEMANAIKQLRKRGVMPSHDTLERIEQVLKKMVTAELSATNMPVDKGIASPRICKRDFDAFAPATEVEIEVYNYYHDEGFRGRLKADATHWFCAKDSK